MNARPLAPEASALTSLSYSPRSSARRYLPHTAPPQPLGHLVGGSGLPAAAQDMSPGLGLGRLRRPTQIISQGRPKEMPTSHPPVLQAPGGRAFPGHSRPQKGWSSTMASVQAAPSCGLPASPLLDNTASGLSLRALSWSVSLPARPRTCRPAS